MLADTLHPAEPDAEIRSYEDALQLRAENHAYGAALHYMNYNFGRIHKSLRVSPAMQAGISDHVWLLEEIAVLAN